MTISPLDAALGSETRAVRTAIDQSSGVAGFHVRRHLPLVCVGVATVAAAKQTAACRQRLFDRRPRPRRRRRRLFTLAKFQRYHFRLFSELRFLTAGLVRRRPVFGLQTTVLAAELTSVVVITRGVARNFIWGYKF